MRRCFVIFYYKSECRLLFIRFNCGATKLHAELHADVLFLRGKKWVFVVSFINKRCQHRLTRISYCRSLNNFDKRIPNAMKIALLTLLIVLTLCLPFTFAQDASQWHLPEGAKARLGRGWVTQVEFSPDGTRLAVAGSIGIWIYDARTYQEIALLTGHTATVESISFSKDGKMLASGIRNRTIRLWDVPKGELRKTLIGHLGDVAMGELRKTFGNIG